MGMPSQVSAKVSLFDRFATRAATIVSKAWFFAACVLLVLIWAPLIFLGIPVDTWQLIINTATTIITFLLVALLQNTSARADAAVQAKLNAVAAYLVGDVGKTELRKAVGLEEREGT